MLKLGSHEQRLLHVTISLNANVNVNETPNETETQLKFRLDRTIDCPFQYPSRKLNGRFTLTKRSRSSVSPVFPPPPPRLVERCHRRVADAGSTGRRVTTDPRSHRPSPCHRHLAARVQTPKLESMPPPCICRIPTIHRRATNHRTVPAYTSANPAVNRRAAVVTRRYSRLAARTIRCVSMKRRLHSLPSAPGLSPLGLRNRFSRESPNSFPNSSESNGLRPNVK
ncbi:hypothetical protein E2542_SST21319 [Spatholobus suberectus]|nr:hypothetical protein E2542_SST21319 [Spatholobus suberectus]